MKRTTTTRRSTQAACPEARPAVHPRPCGSVPRPGAALNQFVSLEKIGQELLHGTIDASAFAFCRTCERGELVLGK